MIDSLASIVVRLIRPKKTNPEILAGLEWKFKSMKEETKTIAPFDYSRYQNIDNHLSIKLRDYKEETIHESETELDMLIIDNDSELEAEPDIDVNYNPDAYYYYTTVLKEEYNQDY